MPRVPVRQWVLVLPKRLCYFLNLNAKVAGDVLKIFLRCLETAIIKLSPGAARNAKIAYHLKKPNPAGITHIFMTPIESILSLTRGLGNGLVVPDWRVISTLIFEGAFLGCSMKKAEQAAILALADRRDQ
jgi:hypothetical protein